MGYRSRGFSLFVPRYKWYRGTTAGLVSTAVLVPNHPNNSTKSRHIALREFRIRDYHELGMIRPYWCPGNYNVADFFSKLLEKGLFTMHAHRFGMNFEETIVGKLAEVYQTVHLKEFTDFPKKDEKDPTTVFTDIHFEKKSVAYEAYHLSHGFCL